MWRAAALAELATQRRAQDSGRCDSSGGGHGDGLILSRSLNSLATIYSEAGQYDQERTYIERALDAAEKTGDPTASVS